MGNYIAGIFAVPKYKSKEISNLPLTSNDCAAMKSLFNTHFGMDDTKIKILGNESTQEVHKLDILTQVRYISRIAQPEDTLIFYFSGHGFSDGNIGYLATFETDLDFPSDTSISIPIIKDELKNSNAKRKLLIIDSCYSGIGTGKRFPSEMSTEFEDSLISIVSEGWVVFASCKSNEMSYFLDDKSMSVFSFYLIEGLKGNADSDGDSIISLEDLNTYVTKNVQKWAIINNKFQTPNIKMELVGTLTFAINNPEISEHLSMEPEISITERRAQRIVLTSEYISQEWRHFYGGSILSNLSIFGQSNRQSEEISEEERKRNLLIKENEVLGYLFASLTNYCKPSQIKIKQNDDYELPFGKIAFTSKSAFEFELKLIISEDLFTPPITDLLNTLDSQDKLKWNSIEYTFKGNFDFDIIVEIILEKEYSILAYQPKKDHSYMTISPKTKSDGGTVPKWTIIFTNELQEAKLAISNENGLEKEFYQTIPISELIDIFSSSLKNSNI